MYKVTILIDSHDDDFNKGEIVSITPLYSGTTGECQNCKAPIVGTARKKYCSNACKQAAYRSR